MLRMRTLCIDDAHACAEDAHVRSWGPAAEMGLGCDEGSMPRCARARLDIDDFVSWDIDHLKACR